jgi:hypothetical protein
MRDVLWNMYTGNISYAKIFCRLIHPVLQRKLVVTTLALAGAKAWARLGKAFGRL